MTTVTLSKTDDFIYMRTICDCSSNRCDVDIILEIEKAGFVQMGIETKMCALPKNGAMFASFYVDIWWRIKTAIRLLFTGYVEMDHYILMSEKGLVEFRDSLEQGIKKIEGKTEAVKPPSSLI